MKLKFMIVALAVLGLRPALYGQNFPTKPIELVVSSSPGGGIDLIFRLLAEELAKTLKVQVNVVNQPAGAGDRRKGRQRAQGRLHAVGLTARPSGHDDRGQSEGPGEFGP